MSLPPTIISGWFCSGTTALWSAFERVPGHVAFYEPLHANLQAHIQYTRPKEGHVGVEGYWHAYESMKESLDLHQRQFAYERTLLGAGDEWPELEAWVQALLAVPAKRAVLKVNRAGFRLAWIKAKWPKARIVHVRRNPRDVWVSSRRHLPTEQWDDAGHMDAYETAQMACALAADLPLMLGHASSTNSYHRLYLLWALQENVASAHADVTIDLEQLKANPYETLKSLVDCQALDAADVSLASTAISDAGHSGHLEYRSEEWFEGIENDAIGELQRLGLDQFPVVGLGELEQSLPAPWREARRQMCWGDTLNRLLLEQSNMKDVMIKAHAEAHGD